MLEGLFYIILLNLCQQFGLSPCLWSSATISVSWLQCFLLLSWWEPLNHWQTKPLLIKGVCYCCCSDICRGLLKQTSFTFPHCVGSGSDTTYKSQSHLISFWNTSKQWRRVLFIWIVITKECDVSLWPQIVVAQITEVIRGKHQTTEVTNIHKSYQLKTSASETHTFHVWICSVLTPQWRNL